MYQNRLHKLTGTSKARNIAIMSVLFGIYLIEKFSPDFIRNTPIFIYVISPVLWTLVMFMVLCFPKPRFRGKIRTMSFLLWMSFLCAVIYLLVMMICGVAFGFGKSPFDHTLLGVVINLFKIFSFLIAIELARAQLINNSDRKSSLAYFAFIAVFITLLNLDPDRITNLETNLDIVEFIGVDLLAELCNSFFATYLVYIGGPILSILYLGIQEGFYWLSPVLPNLNWIAQAFIGILLPIFSMMLFQFSYKSEARTLKDKERKAENPFGWIVVTTVSILIIWFAIGVFPIRPYVILTGSMEPVIYAGDVVLVRRNDIENLQVGDVIQFSSGNDYVFHRIIAIVEEDGRLLYQTKGDNNSAEDAELVEAEKIQGRMIEVIPKIGYPALFFRNADNTKYQF